ncbi:unnamed protein product (macronuclear) [Paramecium tetraurelia]|uniref:Uncharacterized protein n=1 Tax=Paramecium tetraurelia TaxID=5888 RepID=A0D3R2_PARTE|nr:uncharacterized protein GSPATT00039232001 [Paramecium tetraurelia]CAK77679.1 unnamed protein product [Paramecium tetraurelia]|eukprot:XP_001445076.1 hypothetical protein (macronuclear) [Paramecium tetraurelia strain d4-2]
MDNKWINFYLLSDHINSRLIQHNILLIQHYPYIKYYTQYFILGGIQARMQLNQLHSMTILKDQNQDKTLSIIWQVKIRNNCLIKKGYEVLLLEDPVDEFTFQHLNEYKQKKLTNVGKGDFKQPEDNDEQRKKQKALKKVFQPLTDWWRKLLSENVDSVVISQRLIEDPIIVVSSESGYSANMERISKAQAYSSKGSNSQQFGKKIVEINPNHQAIQELLQRVKDDPDQETEEMAKVLYEAALVNSGYSIPNPEKFASRFYKLFNSALGIDRDAPIKDFEVEIEEEPETSSEPTVDQDGTKWEKVNTDDAKWETVSNDKRDDL